MRVLFITRKWPPAVGGMEVYCVELTQELERHVDLTTHYLSGRRNGQPPGPISLAWFFFQQALFLLRSRNRFDVIHYGDLVLFPLAWWCHLLGRRCRQVISVHGTDIAYGIREGGKPALYRRFLAWAASNRKAADVLIANSQATAEHCRNVGLENARVVPLGVRMRDEAVGIETAPENYLLFVGRLARRKGVGWFAREVMPKLPTGMCLKVAGTVWDTEEGQAMKLDRVEFLGPVFGAELAELRRHALAVIMPNIPLGGRDFEGFGLTALEAGAEGTVLLASAMDGIVDAVEDGVTGLLVEPGNADAWVAAIQGVAGWDLEKRREFLERARSHIASFYNWRRVAEDTIRSYDADDIGVHDST